MLKKKISPKYIKLFRYFKPHKKKSVIGGIFLLINVILLLPTPLLTMYLIDDVLPQKDFRLLGLISLLALFIILLRALFGSFQQIFFQRFNECVIFKIQLDLFQKVQLMPYKARKKMQTGYLMSRVKDDPERLHSLLVETLFGIIKDVLTLLVGIAIVFYIHWKLAIISLILLPFYAKIFKYFNKKIRDAATDYYEDRAHVSKKIQESIHLYDLFRIFNANKYDTIKLIKFLKKSIRSSIHRTNLVAFSSAAIGFVGGVGPILVIWYGIYEIMQGRLLLGELIAFNSYLGYLFGPTNRLIKINLSIQQSKAAWDRIYEYLIPSNNKDETLITETKLNIQGEVLFNKVSFAYNQTPILRDLSFKIPANSSIAIIGESGCGKTTLTSLLTQINTDYSGDIFIDGTNIKHINSIYLRNQISVVSQEPLLFSDSIYQNIKIGDSKINLDEIVSACKTVNIHDFIELLPQKYDTIIDERSINLSIGQKQRIAIARAIVRNPKILILDEPTSSLDVETEKLIFGTLNKFIQSRTTIVITHRLAINLNFDYIVCIKDGIIAEIGKPNELLLNSNSIYSSLLNS